MKEENNKKIKLNRKNFSNNVDLNNEILKKINFYSEQSLSTRNNNFFKTISNFKNTNSNKDDFNKFLKSKFLLILILNMFYFFFFIIIIFEDSLERNKKNATTIEYIKSKINSKKIK